VTKSRGINAPAHFWTEADLAIMRACYPNTASVDIARTLGLKLQQIYSAANRMGLVKSTEFLSSEASGRLAKGHDRGVATRFKKDMGPWNTGCKSVRLSQATEFKPGQRPANHQEVGAIRINSDGDMQIKLGEGMYQWVSMRRYVWEMAYGPIPERMCIVVLDGDPCNVLLSNLRCVSRAENVRINLLRKYPKELRNLMALGGKLRNQISKSKEESHA
jgi:hypothetical protein